MNPFDIAGKVILVTGGTRGLGRAISLHLASQKARIVAGYFMNEQAAEEFRAISAREGYDCTAVKANLMTPNGIQALYDQVIAKGGGVDALVYNSATGVHKPLEALTQRHLSTVFQVNVGAFFDLSLKLKPHMPRGARIVALSSLGAVRAVDDYGAVGASKGALESLCRQMAVEWATEGIHVNVISPGLLQTDSLNAMRNPDARVAYEERVSPMGRLVSLGEVASVVHFLCSAASEGINGQTLVVDGGKQVSGLAR